MKEYFRFTDKLFFEVIKNEFDVIERTGFYYIPVNETTERLIKENYIYHVKTHI